MTAVVHLIRNPLDPFERESYEVEDGTQIIDWLQEVAPDGFGMPIELYVNQQKVEVPDADRVLNNGDVCACIVTPGFDFISIGVFLLKTLVAATISFAIGQLFAPKPPRAQRGPNPVYDIGASQNQARLGEPIPLCYGEPLTVPDFAARPYTFFSRTGSDDQLVDQLFCIGIGAFQEITAEDILIGDTPASEFPADVLSFRQFQVGTATGNISSHGGVMGNIANFSWTTQAFGAGELIFQENVYTAPEITNWEFKDDITRSTTVVGKSVTFTNNGSSNLPSRDFVEINIDADVPWRAGNAVTLSGSSDPSHNGEYYVLSVVPDTTSPLDPDNAHTKVNVSTLGPVGENPVSGTFAVDYVVDEISSQARTPWYRAQPDGETIRSQIQLDFVAPQGLYRLSDSGKRLFIEPPYAPKLRIEAEEIDPVTGDILNDVSPNSGFSLVQVYEQQARQIDPLRRTILLQDDDVANVPFGNTAIEWRNRPYVVRVTAEHTFIENNQWQQRILWTGLKGSLSYPTPNEAYGNVTLLAVRMRGTNGISQEAQNRFRVRARRIYTLQDGTQGVSANPVDIINDIYRGVDYGFNRPADEVDDALFTQVRALWDAEDVTCHIVYLQDSTGWDALEQALLPAVAKPALDGGRLTIVADKKKPITHFLFNDMSIQRGSYQATYTIDNSNETDGIEVEYRDFDTFKPAFVRWPTTSVNPQRLVYTGVTDEAYAEKLAHLFWNRRGLQRFSCAFQTEMQGMVPMVGDKISVSSPVILAGDSGRVVSITNNRVVMDKRIVWGANAQIAFTKPDQSPTAWYDVTEGPEPNVAVLSSPVAEALDMSLLRTPASWHFRSDFSKPRDMTITSIQHSGGTTFRINAINYPEDDPDTGDNPLFEGAPGHLILDWDGTPL